VGETETRRVAQDATTHGEPARVEPLPEFEAGDRIGRYIVRALLGAGAMGAVYRAQDPELDRLVAIKVLQRRRGSTRDHRALLREAQALARLSHPNVIAIYDVGFIGDPTTTDALFIAMELVEGTDLAGWLAQPRSLPEILDVFVAAARGLAAAHAVGIVHRDFKPANVLLGRAGHEVRVADFGLARMQADASADHPSDLATGLLHTQLTATGFVVGTPAYMAPEVHAGRAADAAADQYAFFVAFFEAIYGRRPFTGIDLEVLVAFKCKGLARVPDDVIVPSWLEPMILRGLARDPAARFESLATVADLLEQHRRGRGRGRLLAAVAGVGLVAATAIALVPRDEGDRCAHVDALVAETWSPERAAALSTAGSGDTVDRTRLRVGLDDYANRWREAYRERCELVPELGKVPWQQLDPQVRCLRHQWLVFDALVRQLERGDAEHAQAIADALAGLPAPRDCDDADERPAQLEPPPEQLVAVEDLRARADEIEALSLTGRYRDALTALAPIEADAAALGFAPLRVELLSKRGYLHDYLAEYDEAAKTLEQVVYEAESLGYDHLEVRTLRTLLYVMAVHQDRAAEARTMLPRVDALVRRIGDPLIEAEMAELHGIVALYDQDLPVAEARFREALVLADRHLGSDSRLSAEVAANLANLMLRKSRPADAEPLVRRALAYHRAHGAAPNLATTLSLLGIVQFQLGRYREAMATQREALALREELLGPDHPRTMTTVHNLAVLALARGDFEDAAAYEGRELDAIGRGKVPADSARAIAYAVAGEIAMVSGDWARAHELLELALRQGGVNGPRIEAQQELATIARTCGRFDDARAFVERARSADEELGTTAPTKRTYDLDLALVELAQGDAAAAEARLRSALDEIANDPRIEVQQIVQAATVIAAHAARRAGHCAEALSFAARACNLQLGDEGDVAWWRALGWAESAAARRCLGDDAAARRDFAELRTVLRADASTSPELLAAQTWWDLRVPDLARAWATDHRSDADVLQRWLVAHRPSCP
jgi:tetratricopeptide (TPR) repeat protein/tRNA A-37 threonylcarbamoyl transferase component Bud32